MTSCTEENLTVKGSLRFDTAEVDFDSSTIVNQPASARPRTVITGSSYTITSTDDLIGVNYAGAVTVTMPAANSVTAGRSFTVIDESDAASTNNITIVCAGSDTVKGFSSILLENDGESVSFYSDGVSKWHLH